ncbi:NADH-ubiquinone oxidoreductase 78 kDa mitochondrial precursor [Colletotrichum tofieldiae]|nr:NADH-ubiquinone oxidoreductase 78 kDa mitochondrial precursor [Colletotrichum tofieldiae]GKT78747.1 NADH-ubiquinone oxidoreductase 78 kDa mitochondrial precursor [Colletotrichum tofieldiae]
MQESSGNPAETPEKARGGSDSPEEEDKPILLPGAPAMAMFVPLEESLFEPFEAPQNKSDRLKLCQENIEKHTAAVAQNITHMYEREHKRILQHAKKLEATLGVWETTPGLMPGDEELIMEYVNAPIPKDADYSDRHLSTYAYPEIPGDMPPRQAALHWSLYNAGQALIQLGGYATHAQEIKNHYMTALEKELALEESSSDNKQDGGPARS